MIYETCALLWAAQFTAYTAWCVKRIDQTEPLFLFVLWLAGSIALSLANGILMAELTIRQKRRVTHVTAPTANAAPARSVLLPVKLSGPNFRAVVIGPVAVAIRRTSSPRRRG